MADAVPIARVAASLSARERVALFCVATGIDHPAIGTVGSLMHAVRARGLIVHGGGAGRFVLTELGRNVFRILLEQSGFKLAD